MILIYLATRNVFSFQFIFASFLFPVAFSSKILVMNLFCYGVFTIGAGSYLANILINYLPKTNLLFYKNKDIKPGILPVKSIILSFYSLLFFSIFLSIYYYNAVGISLFSDEVGYQRLVARHDVAGSYLFQRIFRVFLPILCMSYYLLSFCKETRYFFHPFIFILLIIITSSFLVFTGMRGNLIIFLFFPFLVLFGMTSQKIKFSKLFLIFMVTFFGGLLVTYLMAPDESIYGIFEVILKRLTSGASDGISYVVESDIPNNGFYYGKTYANDVLSIFSKLGLNISNYQTYGEYLAKTILGENYNGEQAAVYVMGELYANFGMFGLLCGSLLLGIFLQFIYILAIRSKKTVILTPVYAYFQALLIPILGGPSLSMLIDYSITCLFFIITFLMLILFFNIANKRFIFLNKTIIIR